MGNPLSAIVALNDFLKLKKNNKNNSNNNNNNNDNVIGNSLYIYGRKETPLIKHFC